MLKTNTSLSSIDKAYEIGNSSIDWLLASNVSLPYTPTHNVRGIREIKERNVVNIETRMAQIQDPLWRRICDNILKLLGPVAFGELWKAKLVGISPEGKLAYLTCPTREIAEIIEEFHFVVIGALKEFYPNLSSIETEIRVD